MSKIDIEKFICSLRKELCETQYFELIRIIDNALEEQGYEYKDGEIVEIEEQKPLTEEQKAYIDECLKNGSMIRWSDLAYADEDKPDTIHFDKEPEKEDCERCQYLGQMKDQNGWVFKTCSHPPYKGKFVGEIKECPIGKEIF